MKTIVKALADGLAILLVLPAFLLYELSRLFIGAEKSFPGWSQWFSLMPGLPGVFLRRAFYRLVLTRCGSDSCISFGTVFSHAETEIGRNVYVGLYCNLGNVLVE